MLQKNRAYIKVLISVILFAIFTTNAVWAEPWPVDRTNQVHSIWQGYGQYQQGGIHFHEGLDLDLANATPVRAIHRGMIVDVTLDRAFPANHYGNFIVINDTGNPHLGWEYGHIIPANKTHVYPQYTWTEGDIVNQGDRIGLVYKTALIRSHLHFGRVNDKEGWDPRSASGPQLEEDPLLLLIPNTDGTTPDVNSDFLYRNASDEGVAAARYYNVRDCCNRKVIQGNIDIITNASDKFGTFAWNLGVHKIEFRLYKGSVGLINWQTLEEFNDRFVIGYNQFRDPARTQVVYEEDNTANSGDQGPFYYILTNKDGNNTLETTDADRYWDTDGKKGEPWNDNCEAAAHEAQKNADAAFPDGKYTIIIRAEDERRNSDRESCDVIVNNFDQTVESSDAAGAKKDTFTKSEKLYITGEGYLPNTQYTVYVFKDRTWTDCDRLKTLNPVATKSVTTDAKGEIPSGTEILDLKNIPLGKYDIAVDYDKDGNYTTPKLGKSIDALDDNVKVSKRRSTVNKIGCGDTIYIGEEGLAFDVDGNGVYGEAGTPDVGNLKGVPGTITTGAPPLHLSATYTVPEVTEGKYYYDANGNGELNPGEFHMHVKELKIAGDIILNNAAQDSIVGKSVPTSAEIVFKAEMNFGGKIPNSDFKIVVTDPDGVVIETIDGQSLTNLDATHGTTIYIGDGTVGGTTTAPQYADAMDLTDMKTGTYKVKIKTDKTDCNMLDISSPEYTFTIRSEEVAIEAVEDTIGVGEDMVLKVNGNPKDWYYLIVTGIKRVAPTETSVAPEIKDTADVKARDAAGVAYPGTGTELVETNLAAWIQTGSDGVADVKIDTTGADDRTYTIKVYEVPDNVGGVPGATGVPGFVAPNPPAVLVTAATFVPDEVTGANNDVSDVATDDDEVKVKVEEAKVTFDIPASVMVGEEIDIKGAITAGDRIDLIIKDHEIVPGGNDEPVDEDNEFEVKWDTSGYTTGSYTIEGYIDETTAVVLADYDDIDDDGKTTIRLIEPGLTAKQLRTVVAEDDDYVFEGTATGVDDVDYILIGPKGWKSGTAASLVNGLLVSSTSVSDDEFSEEETMTEDLETGAWIALILAPGRDGVYETGDEAGGLAIGSFDGLGAGKNQAQILAIIRDQTVDEAGSDDLLEELRFKVESPYVRLDPIASVAVGEPLNVSGVTNREPETTITISTFAGPMDLSIALAEVEWPTPDEGVFSGSIDTSDAALGTYTIEADDGDGNTDTKDVEIVTAVPPSEP